MLERRYDLLHRTGQIVIEYVLLLAVSVTAATVLTSLIVKRDQNPANQGFVIRIWSGILQKIGADLPEN